MGRSLLRRIYRRDERSRLNQIQYTFEWVRCRLIVGVISKKVISLWLLIRRWLCKFKFLHNYHTIHRLSSPQQSTESSPFGSTNILVFRIIVAKFRRSPLKKALNAGGTWKSRDFLPISRIILETIRYYETPTGNRMRSIKLCNFQWP